MCTRIVWVAIRMDSLLVQLLVNISLQTLTSCKQSDHLLVCWAIVSQNRSNLLSADTMFI